MASGASKSLAFSLLILNLVLYGIITIVAGWALNYGIENTPQSASTLLLPVQFFPMYFAIGNMATGFLVVFSLIAGIVGVATSISGIHNVLQWTVPNILSAATFSITTWALTLLAAGLACKEINIGYNDSNNLRALETLTIILSVTQLICMGALHAGVSNVTNR